MTPPAVPALLEAETRTETDYGGVASAWAESARLWVALTPARPRDQPLGDARPARLESATAEARDDARAAVGQRLTLGAEPSWTVRAIDRASPRSGWMTLRLERLT